MSFGQHQPKDTWALGMRLVQCTYNINLPVHKSKFVILTGFCFRNQVVLNWSSFLPLYFTLKDGNEITFSPYVIVYMYKTSGPSYYNVVYWMIFLNTF